MTTQDAFTPEQLRQLDGVVQRAVKEALADSGIRLDDADHQDEARRDFMFLRSLRRGANGVAAKVGWLIIAAGVGGLVWLVTLGANAWKGLP